MKCGRAASMTPCARPIICAPMPMRPSLSIEMAYLYPWPNSPRRLDAGTLTSSNVRGQVEEARIPSCASAYLFAGGGGGEGYAVCRGGCIQICREHQIPSVHSGHVARVSAVCPPRLRDLSLTARALGGYSSSFLWASLHIWCLRVQIVRFDSEEKAHDES